MPDEDPRTRVVDLFHQVAASVPAYRAFLHEHGVDPGEVRTFADFERLPLLTKENYHRRYPLPDLCRQGRLDGCDMIAVSSGSSGQPTSAPPWPWSASRWAPGWAGSTRWPAPATWPRRATRSRWWPRATTRQRSCG